MRLGRVLAGLAADEPEVHGLVALMELQASRTAARVDAQGRPVLLLEQDRGRWDQLLIRRGLIGLERAAGPGRGARPVRAASRHRRLPRARPHRRRHRLGADRRALRRAGANSAVAGGRAQTVRWAVGMAFGPAEGLAIIDAMRDEPALQNYQWLPSVRGDLLAKLGRKR